MNDGSTAPPPGSPATSAAPRVCIGLPVYNGERFLAGAIASILAQTYTDFELIICDNASTDRTGEICRGFARKDARVRYHRQPRNLGATANFNHCFELASGAYFKWAADGDVLEPRFLEACVEALDDDPGAVLSQSLVKVVDEADRLVEIYDHSAYGTSSPRPSERLSGRLRGTCVEVFGVNAGPAAVLARRLRAPVRRSRRSSGTVPRSRGRAAGKPACPAYPRACGSTGSGRTPCR